jgi:hypothetical protein
MCWFFKRKVNAAPTTPEKSDRSRADDIRKYAKITYITPARKKGTQHISFSAEDIQAGMTAGVRLQSIVSAIDAAKFCEFARVKMTKRAGKKGSSTVRWTFEVK